MNPKTLAEKAQSHTPPPCMRPPGAAKPPPNEELVRQGINAIRTALSSLPAQQGKRTPITSNMAYYKEVHAIHAKACLDKLFAENSEGYIRVAFNGRRPETVRLMYYHGVRYLYTILEPTGPYLALSKQTICTMGDQFILLSRRVAIPVITSDNAQWKKEFTDFLNTEDLPLGAKFHRSGSIFSTEDIQWAQAQLANLEELFIYKLGHTEMLVVRYNKT